MIVSEADLKLIAGKCRRLVIPAERGADGELLPCTLEEGKAFKVAPKHGQKGDWLTVVKVDAALRGETIPAPFIGRRGHGAAWIVTFVPGNHALFFSKHAERYFSKSGITTDPDRAIRTEPAVTTEEEMKLAAAAGYRRDLEDEQAWIVARETIEAAISGLRLRARGDAEVEGDLKFMERRLAKMGRRRQERAA